MQESTSDKLKKTIFMTGGTGYLGSHLMRKLSQQGYRIYGLRRAVSPLCQDRCRVL